MDNHFWSFTVPFLFLCSPSPPTMHSTRKPSPKRGPQKNAQNFTHRCRYQVCHNFHIPLLFLFCSFFVPCSPSPIHNAFYEKGVAIWSDQVESGQSRSDQVRASQMRLEQVRASQIRSEQVRAGQIRSGQVRWGQFGSVQVRSDHDYNNLKTSLAITWLRIGRFGSDETDRTDFEWGSSSWPPFPAKVP